MEGFTIVDGVAAVLIILSALLAYSRGFVREILSIAGWVAAIVVGYMFAEQVRPFVVSVPVVSDFLGDQCVWALFASFVIIMVAGLIIMSIFTPFFANVVQRSALSGFDQGLGFLFGAVRGVALIIIALVIYDFAMTGSSNPMVDDSRTVELFRGMQAKAEEQLPQDVPGWFEERFNEFVAVCEDS